MQADASNKALACKPAAYTAPFEVNNSIASNIAITCRSKIPRATTSFNSLSLEPKERGIRSTDRGTAFDRHNLINRQLKPTCKKLGLTGVTWHWLRHANATLL